MAGAGLIIIKRRIKSITNIRKITKAMGLVATAKLRKARERLSVNESFYSEANNITEEIFENYGKEDIFAFGNSSPKKLYIIFTSEMGLCGGFNVNVTDKAIELIGDNKENSKIMIVGRRGRIYLNKLGQDISAGVVEAPDMPEFKDAEEIAQNILKMFVDGMFGEVYAVFTHFISGVKQLVEVEKLLPIPYKYDEFYEEIIAFEPSLNLLADEAIKLYTTEQILYFMLNSTSSEHSARMNAMNSATKNADELLDKLKLKYNRVRQSIITQEISEIVGGAEALK